MSTNCRPLLLLALLGPSACWVTSSSPALDAGVHDPSVPPDLATTRHDLASGSTGGGGATIAWTVQSSGLTTWLTSVWGCGGDVFVTSDEGVILHSDTGGQVWTRVRLATGLPLNATWCSSANDVYAVGARSTDEQHRQAILHSADRGASWSDAAPMLDATLNAVWGSGPDEVFAVGDAGVIVHSADRGLTWNRQESGTSVSLRGIWGTRRGVVYAVGDNGVIVQSADHGHTWVAVPALTQKRLRSVWGVDDLAFAVGDGDTLLSGNADGTWQPLSVGSADVLTAGYAPSNDLKLVVGDRGLVLRGNAQDLWIIQYETAGVHQTLMAIWGSGQDDIYAVGADGTILHHP